MNKNEFISAADMISRIFENIDKADLEKSNKLFSAWKETVKKVNDYGEKLAAHTKVIDLKNGTLLVETDHPGWSQILQMNQGFILRGLNWKVAELGVKNLMIRLEGSDATFAKVNDDEKQKKQNNKIDAAKNGFAESATCKNAKDEIATENIQIVREKIDGKNCKAASEITQSESVNIDGASASEIAQSESAKNLPPELLAKFQSMIEIAKANENEKGV